MAAPAFYVPKRLDNKRFGRFSDEDSGDSGTVKNRVSIGDLADFKMDSEDRWTVATWYYLNVQTADQGLLIAKDGGSGLQQFKLQLDNGSPESLEVWMGGTRRINTTVQWASNTELYVAVTNDGSATGAGLRMVVFNPYTFQILSNLTGGSIGDAATQTAPISFFAGHDTATFDQLSGCLGHCYGLKRDLSIGEIVHYAKNPWDIHKKQSEVAFHLPMGDMIGDKERDYGPNAAHGTVIENVTGDGWIQPTEWAPPVRGKFHRPSVALSRSIVQPKGIYVPARTVDP